MADADTRLKEVVENIAKEHGYDESSIELKPISSGGANYTSRLFKISLSSPEKEDLKLFAKVATLGEKVRSMSDTQVYEIEIIFYTRILSKFRELEEKHNVPDTERLVLPKYYGGVIDYSEELMVLEDFTVKGFKPFDRFKYFDWNYASTCVGVLARLQALSVAFQKQDPEEFADITGKLKFNASKESLIDFINKSIATALESTDEVYKERVEIFLRNEMKKESFVKFFNPERKVLLTHGDFRPSNILQKTDEDGNLQVVVVDYQMIKLGNPVTDLVYFLISGSDEEFRARHLHQFFNHYYETFSKSLQRLGIDPDTVYKEKDFRDDVKEMLPFGLTLGTFALLFITVEEDDAPKPEEGLDFDKINIKAGNQYQVRFNALVKDYINLGIL